MYLNKQNMQNCHGIFVFGDVIPSIFTNPSLNRITWYVSGCINKLLETADDFAFEVVIPYMTD